MTPAATATAAPMTGPQLDDWMERLEAGLDERDANDANDGIDENDLAARLRAQPLRAHSLDAIDRLHTLWMRAGDPAAARAVLDVDGASVLDAAAPGARPDVRLHLARYRLQIAHHLRDGDAIRDALGEMRAIVDAEPDLDADRYQQLRVLDAVERDVPDHALDAIELRHALHAMAPARAASRAWDEADRQCRRARAFDGAGRDDDAREAANAAFVALLTAGDDQDIGEYDWLHVGDAIIDIAPYRLATIHQWIEPRIAGWAPPQRHDAEVRLARLDARAAYTLGDLHSALAQCELARDSLDSDGGDDFIEYELPWLIEAGCFDDAGRRAFFHLHRLGGGMDGGVARFIHAQLAESSDTSAWWALCAMRAACDRAAFDRFVGYGAADGRPLVARSPLHAQIFAGLGTLEGDALLRAVFEAAHAVVERRAPGQPWAARLVAAREGHADGIGDDDHGDHRNGAQSPDAG